jgi:hypothetical protein
MTVLEQEQPCGIMASTTQGGLMVTRYSTQIACAVALTLISTTFVKADPAQRRTGGPALVPVEISLKIAGQPYDVKGQASCTHAPKGSIYNVVSEMWTVRQEQDGGSVQLTLWKPLDGSASMFTLSTSGKKNTSITTVRGGQVSGSGTVAFAPSGKGGTFTIDARSKANETVTGTITCQAFTPAIAEGGDE